MKSWRCMFGGFVVLCVSLLLGIAAYPFLRGTIETQVLDQAVREAMPKRSFVALPDGVTHYALAGPPSGQVVVMIHGFTTPLFIWDGQFQDLVEAGFRVLRYDLYGRGFSDRPRLRYTADLFDQQLLALLDALEIREPVDLVGMSMGGAVAMHFLDRHPERVRRYALFAPSGFPVHVPLKYQLLKKPLIGEWMMQAYGDDVLKQGRLTRRMELRPDQATDFTAQYREQMLYKGHKRALLSTLRHNPVLHLEALYQRVGKLAQPGMLFWGTKDHMIDYEHHRLVQEAIPSIRFLSVTGAGHTLPYDRPKLVNEALIGFLQE